MGHGSSLRVGAVGTAALLALAACGGDEPVQTTGSDPAGETPPRSADEMVPAEDPSSALEGRELQALSPAESELPEGWSAYEQDDVGTGVENIVEVVPWTDFVYERRESEQDHGGGDADRAPEPCRSGLDDLMDQDQGLGLVDVHRVEYSMDSARDPEESFTIDLVVVSVADTDEDLASRYLVYREDCQAAWADRLADTHGSGSLPRSEPLEVLPQGTVFYDDGINYPYVELTAAMSSGHHHVFLFGASNDPRDDQFLIDTSEEIQGLVVAQLERAAEGDA